MKTDAMKISAKYLTHLFKNRDSGRVTSFKLSKYIVWRFIIVTQDITYQAMTGYYLKQGIAYISPTHTIF